MCRWKFDRTEASPAEAGRHKNVGRQKTFINLVSFNGY